MSMFSKGRVEVEVDNRNNTVDLYITYNDGDSGLYRDLTPDEAIEMGELLIKLGTEMKTK